MTEQNKTEVMNGQEVNGAAVFKITRREFTSKDGRKMWGYLVKGKVRGRDVEVDFKAKDDGGYDYLDIIFDGKPTADLVMHDETMTDESGEKRTYTVYEVQDVDPETGVVYSYQVKPSRDSDKSLLKAMIAEREAAAKKAQTETGKK